MVTEPQEDGRALYMQSRQFIFSVIAEHGSDPKGEGSKSNKARQGDGALLTRL
jgi:hypothetical protein